MSNKSSRWSGLLQKLRSKLEVQSSRCTCLKASGIYNAKTRRSLKSNSQLKLNPNLYTGICSHQSCPQFLAWTDNDSLSTNWQKKQNKLVEEGTLDFLTNFKVHKSNTRNVYREHHSIQTYTCSWQILVNNSHTDFRYDPQVFPGWDDIRQIDCNSVKSVFYLKSCEML